MRRLGAIGYDMDYTLIHYRVPEWERRAFEYVRDKLGDRGWPVADTVFSPELITRGLVVDTEQGNLLKANRFGYVVHAFHGTRPLDFDEQRSAYGRSFVDLRDSRYAFLNTLFSISAGCMYAQLVDRMDEGKLAATLGYAGLYRQVRSSTDEAHMEGQLKGEIIADPDRFVELDPELPLALLDQKHAGKKLLVITNSEWPYTRAMMSYAFDRYLPGAMTWRDLFELVFVAARKPSFFETKNPALAILDDEGTLKPHVGPLEAGGCYFGGNAAAVEQRLGLSGDQILYVGDHMYSDVEVTKSLLRWRTALILRELEEDLAAEQQLERSQRELAQLMADKQSGEQQHCQLRLAVQRKKAGYGPEPGESIASAQREMGELRDRMKGLDERIAPLAAAAAQASNANWGLLMRAGNDKSLMARMVERSADVYTSRVSNFCWATPFAYLRAPRGSLPHDLPSRR
jgi:HAD superfamily 5'-nucleotidase-like hydrolase